MTSSLLLHLSPLPGESVRGFLRRLADKNSYEQVTWLKDVADLEEFLRPLVGVSLHGSVPSWTQRLLGVKSHTIGIRQIYIVSSTSRFCPLCLAEEAIWKWVWEYSFYVSCSKHRMQLLGNCTKCGEDVKWTRRSLSQCLCGASFSQMSSMTSDVETHRFCQFIEKKLLSSAGQFSNHHCGEHQYSILEKIDILDIANLILMLGSHTNKSASTPTQRNFRPSNIKHANALVFETAHLLKKWPTGFKSFLKFYSGFTDKNPLISALPKDFLRLVRIIHGNFKPKKFDFLRSAYTEFMRSHWHGSSIALCKISEEDIEISRFISKKSVIEKFHIPSEKIENLMLHGILVGRFDKSENRPERIFIEQDSAKLARNYIENQITKKSAEILLGISEERVDELVNAGIIHIFHKFDNSSLSPYFSCLEISQFVEHLSVYRRRRTGSDEEIFGHRILEYYGFSDSEFVKFISDILVGKLPTLGHISFYRGISGLIFNTVDFNNWWKETRSPISKFLN
ncbi:TniQ family protein [Undibacterium sp. LFS511W]|uniref:TniQ family protein n=2 Tax=Undibacterium luofuense TaxID=2828733 RepID=A0A941DJG2_9BURK|nr:TniQ family protein [Undibacterium luofuense]